MFSLLFFLAASLFEYESKSVFGHEGRDEVLIEYIDGFQIIGNATRPPVKHIKLANFTDIVINDDDYPWYKHQFKGTCTLKRLQQETNAVYKKIGRTNMTQDELFYHPAALKQYFADEHAVNNAQRIVARVTICPKYYKHAVPIFVPPGELITITVPDDAIGKIQVCFNVHEPDIGFDGKGYTKERLNKIRVWIKLNQKVNTIGTPYGGCITFEQWMNIPITFTISGVILAPMFKYGATSDADWEKIKKYPGPLTYIDTGNTFSVLPTQYARSSYYRINDALKWWRSAYQISQTSAKDTYSHNPRDGRILNPPLFCFSLDIPFLTWGYAMIGANYLVIPPDAASGLLNYNGIQGGNWGNIHEMNHHHQSGWASGGYNEISNNGLNLEIYARTSSVQIGRTENGGVSGANKNAHPALIMNSPEAGLALYADLINFFGDEKFHDFVRSDQYNTLFNRNDKQIGRRGAQMLRASKIFNRDMRYEFNFHGLNDSVLQNHNENSTTMKQLDEMNLKPFHPVATIYGVGYIIDGVPFESARPYRIWGSPTSLDFTRTKVQRSDKEKFGDFVFSSLTPKNGTEHQWIPDKKVHGRYVLRPNEDPSIIEECVAHYLDKTTNLTTDIICKFQQKPIMTELRMFRNVAPKFDTLEKAYERTSKRNPNNHFFQEEMDCPEYLYYKDGWLATLNSTLHVEESGFYRFGIKKGNRFGKLYFSNESLALNPEEDADCEIMYTDKVSQNWLDSDIVKSEPIFLEAFKKYYIAMIIYKPEGTKKHFGMYYLSSGIAGITHVNKTTLSEIPKEYLTANGYPYEYILRKTEFVPNFRDMPFIDAWTESDTFHTKTGKWDVYKYPVGQSIFNSNKGEGQVIIVPTTGGDAEPPKSKSLLNQEIFDKLKDDDSGEGETNDKTTITSTLTDSDETTEYRVNWTGKFVVPFPHIFEIDMGDTTSFRLIKIIGTSNKKLFDMDSCIEIRAGNTNETNSTDSIQNSKTIIYSGNYTTSNPYIEFDNAHQARYLRLTIFNNSKKWKNNKPGSTSISGIEVGERILTSKVLPQTLSLISYEGNWTATTDGYYYNGKATTGTAGSVMKYTVPAKRNEFGIIGDLWNEMGSASVYLDGTNVFKISKELMTNTDFNRLKYSHRSFRQVLYFVKFENDNSQEHKIELHVESGNITFAGILTDCSEHDCVFDDSNEHKVDTVYPTDNSSNDGKVAQIKASSIVGIIIGIVVVVVVIAIVIFVVGARKGLWCKRDNSEMAETIQI